MSRRRTADSISPAGTGIQILSRRRVMTTEKIGTFRQGTLTGSELQDAVAEAWAEIAKDPDLLAELDVDSQTASTVTFSVDEEGGFVAEGILLGIAVGWAGGAAWDGTKKLSKLIVTKVRARRGEDAIGDEVDDEGAAK
jgi:hypothetical protein